MLPRAPRSTRAKLAVAEAHQSAVIQSLHDLGEARLADRLERCQADRLNRRHNIWPWQCRSAACHACRRATVRRWFRGALLWLCGHEVSLATIPLTDSTDLIPTIRRLRKSLRDVRDRAARADTRWAPVAMGGIVSDEHLMLLIQHDGIGRSTLWNTLERRWPDVVVGDVGDAVPTSAMTVQETVALAVQRRGIEPLRVVIPVQRRADQDSTDWNDAMPVVI